jgi:hypothetical protein
LSKVASNYVDINKSTKYPLTEINEYYISLQENMEEIKVFLRNLDEDIYTNISSEIHSSTIQIITTLNENMENLSGYMESNTKLLDYKLEKHFNKVDSSLSEWRNKNKGGVFKQLFQRLHILIAKM